MSSKYLINALGLLQCFEPNFRVCYLTVDMFLHMDLLCIGTLYQYLVDSLLINAFVFPNPEPPIVNILYG